MTATDERAEVSGGLVRYVPGVRLVRTYQRSWLRPDLVAGLVLATLLVPQGMAYAELAGLPPVTGLYTTVACLIGYAIMGPSRILVLGPDSSVSPMILAAIAPLLAGDKSPAHAIELAGMLGIAVGLVEIGLGVGRLGFVADLLSTEVKIGYMNGLAVVIVVGQLPKICGFSTDASGVLPELRAWFDGLGATSAATLTVGLVALLGILALPKLTSRVPAILVVIVGATVVSAVFSLKDHGVATVGALPQGLPRPQVPWTSAGDAGRLLLAALGITLVSLTDTIATSASFAARRGDRVSADQEMIGVGAANIAAGFFQGFAVSSSASRTAVADRSGARSQVTGVVGAGVVVLLLVAFNSLLADLPQAVLGAVVIAAAFSLVDVQTLRRYWPVRRSAVMVSLVASVGVILLGVLPGILVAVGLAILLFFRRNWWPHGEVLGRQESGGWHSLTRVPGGREVEGIVVFRWEAPLFFANAGLFRRQVVRLVREKHARWVVLQCEAITDVDVTAADMLANLDLELEKSGVHLAFVEVRTRLHQLLGEYGLFETLDVRHVFPVVDAAVAALQAEEASRRTGAAVTSPTAPGER